MGLSGPESRGGGGVDLMVATSSDLVATAEVVLYHLSTSPSSGYVRFECQAKTYLPMQQAWTREVYSLCVKITYKTTPLR